AQIEIARRANYFILPDTGLVSIESDLQIFLDVPKLAVGDVNGDARTDIVSSTRHEIRVFLRQQDGGFARQPSRTYPLRLVTPKDHISGSGGVTAEAHDIDGDHRLDLLISHVEGGFGNATTTINVHMNHDGEWNLDAPDQTMVSESSLGSNVLYDIDGDGRQELLRIELQFGVFEIIELLVTREIDIQASIHAFEAGTGFREKPLMRKKLSIPISFDTFRPKGFFPTANIDLNADGFLDFVSSAKGDAIEVYLGDSRGPFSNHAGRQRLSSAGNIHFGDLNRDRLPDFLIFDPHHFDVPVQVGRNLGTLEGTPATIDDRPELP
ncbi:MAG: FG-GAP repeat domain-containing protein, partial [Pseudomonadales bacterium]